VSDRERSLVGINIPDLDLVEALVRELCHDSIVPPLAPIIERIALPTAAGGPVAVLKVDVPRSLFVHRSPGGYLLRVGSSKREMSPEYLARLFQQRSQVRIIRFDEQVVPDAGLDDLDEALWRRFATPRSRDTREDLLQKLGMAQLYDDGIVHPTLSGILMASQDPRRWLPNAFIQAVAYRGREPRTEASDIYYQLDAADISGPLDRQIVEACRFVLRNMKTAAKKYMGRVDLPQYDMTAVFEAVVNAVAHRDYSIHGSKIRLRMFEDRLELFSPGMIPNTMTVDSLPYRQSARNETLTSLLARCPVPEDALWLRTDRESLMDKRGEGVRIILDSTHALAGRAAEYRVLDDAELLLTIPAANP
jgi:predicted HTH transcriptional regulator